MKVVAIIFSAQRRGNCFDISERILELISKKGVEIEMIKTVNLART